MQKLSLLVVMLTLTSVSFAQRIMPSEVRPQLSDISASQSVEYARQFQRLAGQPLQDASDFTVILEEWEGVYAKRAYYVSSKFAQIYVHSETGKIISFDNAKRSDDRYRKRGRSGAVFSRDEAVLKAHLEMIAGKFGLPADRIMSKFGIKGDLAVNDADRMGYFGCVFRNEAGKILATLACDIQDGVILEFTRSRDR